MPVNAHPFRSEDVMAYLDGELSPETAAEMTAHLSQCRACQDIAADLQGVSRQLSSWTMQWPEAETMPAQIVTALETRAAERTPKRQPFWLLQRSSWVVVATSFACCALVLLWIAAYRSGTVRMARTSRLAIQEDGYIPTVPQPSAVTAPPVDSLSSQIAGSPTQEANEGKASPDATPLIVRTAELRLTARSFDTIRADLDRVLAQFGGHIAQLDANSPIDTARRLSLSLRIPAPKLDAALAELRKLGHVDTESQRGEEVTQQSVDLEARLSNAHHTEQRLTQILATRTGKLSDVLEVEEKLSEVRGQIEQAEAEQKSLNNRVSLATVTLQVIEDYRSPLTSTSTPSVGSRLSNSAVDGLHAASAGLIGFIQFLLTAGPSLLLICLVLGLPAYFLWKKLRHR